MPPAGQRDGRMPGEDRGQGFGLLIERDGRPVGQAQQPEHAVIGRQRGTQHAADAQLEGTGNEPRPPGFLAQ